ncbi:MAG: hypothetical protein V2J55_10740 [Candidatus Competibacteraceae bacterium]|nr:hypothetical protein [Candidatus Competibacteraceae bacterium]
MESGNDVDARQVGIEYDLISARPRRALWIVWFCITLITGCATTSPTVTSQDSATEPAAVGESIPSAETLKTLQPAWWRVQFRIHWPQDEAPDWAMDVLLAHRVVAPVLSQYRDSIELWRFHRRAARDGAGRQFSFIFYAKPRTAERIYTALQADPLLQQLQAVKVVYTPPHKNKEPYIESTSDPNWSAVIQKSWPYFIMGVSEMWLDLIDQIVKENLSESELTLEELEQYYAEVNEAVAALWRTEGQHAFLHHLNAVFGYQPLLIRY